MSITTVYYDQTSTDTTLNNGDELIDLGAAIGTIVNSGGQLLEQDGGLSRFAIVNSGGNEIVSSGGSMAARRPFTRVGGPTLF